MNAQESYKKIEKVATTLAYGWVVNNILGLIYTVFSIYFIWWKWRMGFLGVLVFIANTWFFNGFILPTIFGIFNQPFAEKARDGAIELEDMGIIDTKLSLELNNTKVEYWPKHIVQNLTDEKLQMIFPDKKI